MVDEKTENGVAFPYMKPPKKTTWEAFSTLMYNKSDHTVLGRTGKNWVKLLVFYTIFYACLAALFAICMQGLFATLDDKEPRWQLDRSLIGTNPGMGFRPISERTEGGSLIWFNAKNATQIQRWINLLDKFLDPYIHGTPGNNQVPCDFNKPPGPGQVCSANGDDFGFCSYNNGYGYNTSTPCVYLKLNRIFGWVPEYYNDPNNLPAEMPADLVEYIKREYNLGPERANQIWVSCQGEHPADKERVSAEFEFFPNRGFPSFFYPFRNQPGYLSPLIAVKINQLTPNVIVNIECRAWAKNINYRGGNREREGSIHFEIMRDVD